VVTISPTPATPAITANGPTSVCGAYQPLTLTSSAATGNQWFRNGSPIAAATGTSYITTTTGTYTVQVTANACPSAMSAPVDTSAAFVSKPVITLFGGAPTACDIVFLDGGFTGTNNAT